ncbi:MAG: hypothetical protein IPF99_24945 [Deltaproteobacteria bacterium]|nr:hypothetical protein [Deltaproteobacteria bacterium]
MAVLAIVLGVFAILSSLGETLLVALGTSFFALNTRWEGDWNEVMRSGCAFAVPLLIAFVLGVVAIVGGSRKSSAHSWLALALGAIGLALVPATFIVPLVLLKATAPREELGGPSAIQYMDPNEIGRACHAGPTLNGDCTVGYSCMGASSRTRRRACSPARSPASRRTTIVPIGRRAAHRACACSTGRVRAVPIWVWDGGDLIEGKPIAPPR